MFFPNGKPYPQEIQLKAIIKKNQKPSLGSSIGEDCTMAKYQFFQLAENDKKLVRYLCTDREDFLPAKELLLKQGFEVIGDMIYANNDEEAIDHFNSGMIYPLAEYNKAHEIGGLFYFVQGIYEEARNYYRRRASASRQNKPNL